MIKYKKILICLVAIFLILPIALTIAGFSLSFAFASDLNVNLPGLPDSPTVIEYAAYLFNLGMAIAGSLALLAIAIGGTYYLVSFNRGKYTGEGKEWVRAGITGLLILLCAYLIAYTINPDLLSFRLPMLPPIRLFGVNIGGGHFEPITEVYYQEIPIGTLTETLLSKPMFCYDFDPEGNPIPLPLKTDKDGEVNGPTYSNHDRVDCLLKLMDAAQKKGKIISDLSKEIKELMETCECDGKCDDPCNKDGKGCKLAGTGCAGACVGNNRQGTQCKQPQGSESCCDSATKEKIEHGPIKIDCSPASTSIPNNISVDPVFPLPSSNDNSVPCQIKSTGGVIKKTKDIVIGSDIDREAVQWAIDQWNKYTPYKVFGKIIVSDSAVNSYCFYDIYGNCKGKTLPTNVHRIYNQPIDTKGATAWQPPAYAYWNIDKGEITHFDINLDLDSSFFDSKDKLKTVLLHELGHALGLDDAYDKKTGKRNPNCKDSIMNTNLVLEPGEQEIEAIKSLYGMPAAFLYNPYFSLSYQQNQAAAINFGVAFSTNSNSACCPNPEKEYKGLDEFRTQLSSVSNLIEKKVQVDKEDVAVININGRQGVQTPKQWSDLKLIEQLIYYKEKIKEIQSDIKNDINKLDSAREKVASCYKVKSSVDFLKLKEGVKKEDKKIIESKQWDDVDSSKYCKGFNYANSSCYKLCSDTCPDTTQEVAKCYSKCTTNRCNAEDKDCLDKQQECIGDCYESRACLFQDPSNKKSADTFKKCVSNCREDCSELCSKRYLLCSEEYKQCQNQCENNSKCILENKDTCLINSRITNTADFQNCITQEDYSNIKNCINSSYLCKYGSNEYAGYPDCTNGFTGCAPNTQNFKNEEYSSPYIFDNWDEQRCPNPYKVCEEGKNAGTDCISIYPETAKCPSNSSCPKCPCGEVEEKITFLGTDSSESVSEEISAHSLVTAECNEFTYNADPLTFYCETTWQQEEYLSGAGFVCSYSDEIPIGQAVDDSKKWANDLLETVNSFSDSITSLLDTAKKINDKKPNEYCRCDSKYDVDPKNGEKSGQPICTSDCQYNEGGVFIDEDGNPVEIPPSCTLIPCNGNPCQQMINYLEQISKDYEQMRTAFINTYINFLKEPRTDPLKELSYARQKMSSCSQQMVQFGADKVNTISCTLAYPGTSFLKESCYGVVEGAIQKPPKDQTDNWFCCRKEKE